MAGKYLGDGLYVQQVDGQLQLQMLSPDGAEDYGIVLILPVWLGLVGFVNNNMPLEYHVGGRRKGRGGLHGGARARRKREAR